MQENSFLKDIKSSSKADEVIANLSKLKKELEAAQLVVADTTSTTENETVVNTVDDSVNAVIMLKHTLLKLETLVDFFSIYCG